MKRVSSKSNDVGCKRQRVIHQGTSAANTQGATTKKGAEPKMAIDHVKSLRPSKIRVWSAQANCCTAIGAADEGSCGSDSAIRATFEELLWQVSLPSDY